MSTLSERVKQFEGYTDKPQWDYKQWSVGYGTRASGPNDVVDKAEAERRLERELGPAAAIVDKHAPNLPPGVRDALTSLTYNAGDAWTRGGLGQAIKSGDMEAAKSLFAQYNKAGGEVLPGLTDRRKQELSWWDNSGTTATAPNLNRESPSEPQAMQVANAPQTAAGGAPAGLLGGILGQLGVSAPQDTQQPAQKQLSPLDYAPQDEASRISYVSRAPARSRMAVARAAVRRA